MKTMKKTLFLVLFSISSFGLAFEAPPQRTITVRVGPQVSPSVPESCRPVAEIAVENYLKNWKSDLFTGTNVHQESIDKAEKRIQDEVNEGRIPANRHLSPLGTIAVFLDDRDLMGTFSSLFVDCDKRLAFISKRGGIDDKTRWFGPFNF